MYFKRNEPFRYTFGTPLLGDVQHHDQEARVEIKIWDISQHGMRFEPLKQLHTQPEDTIHVFFTLLDQEFSARGEVKWVKPIKGTQQIGVVLDTDGAWRQTLVNTLKQYAKKHI